MNHRLDELIDAHLDHTITDDELDELEGLLTGNASALRRLALRSRLHAALHITGIPAFEQRTASWSRGIGLAAAGLIATLGATLPFLASTPAKEPAAHNAGVRHLRVTVTRNDGLQPTIRFNGIQSERTHRIRL